MSNRLDKRGALHSRGHLTLFAGRPRLGGIQRQARISHPQAEITCYSIARCGARGGIGAGSQEKQANDDGHIQQRIHHFADPSLTNPADIRGHYI